jgi:mono/diheme cytochrome c family protein
MLKVLIGFIIGIVFTVLAALGAGYMVITNGVIAANADAKPGAIERWIARTSLRATLQREAPKGPNPVALNDANLIAGIHLYQTHCAVCHGTAAGDKSPTPIADGENPNPPLLGSHGVEDDPEGWTFWKIKHGIRWTGMPAWERELNDRQIWTLAQFLKHMDKLPPGPQAAWQAIRVGETAGSPGNQAAPIPAPGKQ